MANHASAVKRHRQSLKSRDRNRDARAAVRDAIKSVREALQGGNKSEATKAFGAAQKAVAKAANKGLYHPKNAARKISRLASAVAKTSKAK